MQCDPLIYKFSWQKEMRDGLHLSVILLLRLSFRFGGVLEAHTRTNLVVRHNNLNATMAEACILRYDICNSFGIL